MDLTARLRHNAVGKAILESYRPGRGKKGKGEGGREGGRKENVLL